MIVLCCIIAAALAGSIGVIGIVVTKFGGATLPLMDRIDSERQLKEQALKRGDEFSAEIDAKNAQLKDMFARLGAAETELKNAHAEAVKHVLDIAKDANATTVEQLLNALMQAPPVARVAAGAEDGARPLAIVRPGPETSSAR